MRKQEQQIVAVTLIFLGAKEDKGRKQRVYSLMQGVKFKEAS
jgi:hypothetical protein